jgi:hypothetical protein
MFFSSIYCHFLFVFLLRYGRPTIGYNVWALGEEGDFTHQTAKYFVAPKLAQNFY